MRFVIAAFLAGLAASPAVADPCNAPLPAKGERFAGEVTYIVDGDGFCAGHDQGGVEVRLADFNACELSAPGGAAARDKLREIVFGKVVECIAGKRSYDRVIAQCTIAGKKLGDAMRASAACEGGRGSNNAP